MTETDDLVRLILAAYEAGRQDARTTIDEEVIRAYEQGLADGAERQSRRHAA